ncbi:MAG: hypothetical protein CVU46_12660 [Chloroflexi bacterium HGW-Chloroflexi-8]|jgi:hypothetical protein|nr:MAG: hypothetical protein CVU46_12660 [Chloroflexi bacterium HGW-Chloroflexi-8]
MFDQYSNSSDTKGLSERFSTESKSGQWLGLFPLYGLQSFFLILMLQGRLFPSSNSENIWLPSTIFFLVMIVFLVAYVIGWKQGFPRWWFGFPLCLILISTFLQQSEGPDGAILAWRAWIPFGLATFIAVLISLSPSRYHKLRQGIWQDPSRLVYAVYTLLPIWSILIMDEMSDSVSEPLLALSFVLFFLGGLFYFRSDDFWRRVLVLFGTAFLTSVMQYIFIVIYWTGKTPLTFGGPIRWQDQVPGALLGLSMLTFAMLMPVIILEYARLIRNRKRFDANLFNGTKPL